MRNKALKHIFYQSVGLHTFMQTMIQNPPEGYEYIVDSMDNRNGILSRLKKSRIITFLYKRFKGAFNVLPLLNAFYYKSAPNNADIILTTNVIVKENRPWVMLILDSPFSMSGNDYNLFMKNKSQFEKYLSSPNCKAILVHTESSKKILERYFSKNVSDKIKVITPGITINSVKEKKFGKKVTFLFMGSINNPQEFLIKGGLEVLETFSRIRKAYPNTELIMRCKVPDEIKSKYSLEGVKLIEKFISKEELEDLYQSSDVLFLPGYCYFIMAYFEAFSHGLPVLALDTYGVSEFIKQGKNGFYVKPSEKVPIQDPAYPSNMKYPSFLKAIRDMDERVINDLYNKAEMLIKNKSLRERMSKDTLSIFKKRFSIESQNRQLKMIFDEVLNVKQ